MHNEDLWKRLVDKAYANRVIPKEDWLEASMTRLGGKTMLDVLMTVDPKVKLGKRFSSGLTA